MMMAPVQNYQGPTDPMLRSSNVSGYSQVSRIGEQVVNAFVDGYEYGGLPESLMRGELAGDVYKDGDKFYKASDGAETAPVDGFIGQPVEHKPYFHEWATAYVGMIALSRRMRTNFRNHMAAEAASPVVVCGAGRGPLDEIDFQFAGVVRSNSVRTMDDGVGPTVDEYFTLTTSGMMTLLNTSGKVIHPGDTIAWTLESSTNLPMTTTLPSKGMPRRVGIRAADFHDENVIGRALSPAKPGATFDAFISLM